MSDGTAGRPVGWMWAGWGLLAAAVLAGLGALFVQLPWWLDGHRLRALDDVADDAGPAERRAAEQAQQTALARDHDAVLKVYAGIGAAIALIYTARRHIIDQRTLDVTRERDARTAELTLEGQVTDR